MAIQEERLRSIIESILLLSPEPVPLARMIEVVSMEDPHTPAEAIRAASDALLARYADPERPVGRGFRVEEVAGGFQLRTVPENADYLRRFLAARPQRLSRPALETLAVIAYRQPVTKPDMEAIRGVDVGAVLKALLDRDLVRILGKKEEVGRPLLYGTTKYFLEFFGLSSLAELPTLREFHELDGAHQKEVDELYEREEPRTKLSELAAAATFLVERKEDPDLEALDKAVLEADRARHQSDLVLDPTKLVEPGAEAGVAGVGAGESMEEVH